MTPKALLFAIILPFTSTVSEAVVIASLDVDYGTDQTGWSYQWNPTGVEIGTSSGYQDLTLSSDDYVVSPTAASNDDTNSLSNTTAVDTRTGIYDNTFASSGPQVFDNVTSVHGGLHAAASTDGFDHYAIFGYTVQVGDQIGEATFNHDGSSGSAGTIRIFVNDTEKHVQNGSGGAGLDFSESIGEIVEGDTIYFAWRSDVYDDNRNNTRLFTDFDIDVVPEPSSSLLVGLGSMGLLARRRR